MFQPDLNRTPSNTAVHSLLILLQVPVPVHNMRTGSIRYELVQLPFNQSIMRWKFTPVLRDISRKIAARGL